MSLEQEILADTVRPTKDKLDRVRDAVRNFRDLDLGIKVLEERAAEMRGRRLIMTMNTLPEIFMDAGVDSITLQSEGNMPAYQANLEDYYHAKISTDWDEEKQKEAYDLLEKRKSADIIKHTVEIRFGLKETKLFKQFMALFKGKAFKELKKRIVIRRSVPWNTLTALIRETYEKGGEFKDEELRLLGATVGKTVKLKEIHDV
jgi:hypothetical protein